MVMNTPTFGMFRDTVSVETYTGDSAYGPLYAESVDVICKVSSTRQLVRNMAGDEVVSEAVLYVQPHLADPFVPESRLTINGRSSVVIGVNPMGRPGEINFVKVVCS